MEHNPTTEVVTPPSSEPVTLSELKDHLKLSGTAEDALLATYLTSAREAFEHHSSGRIVLPTVFRQWEPCWGEMIRLERARVTAVSSVWYYDQDDQEQQLTGWSSDLSGTVGLVYFPGVTLPSLSPYRPRPIKIQYTAGWANAGSVPSSVKFGIMTLAGHFYRYRESHSTDNIKDVPMGFKNFCDQWATGIGGY